jgi:hypothetical protein
MGTMSDAFVVFSASARIPIVLFIIYIYFYETVQFDLNCFIDNSASIVKFHRLGTRQRRHLTINVVVFYTGGGDCGVKGRLPWVVAGEAIDSGYVTARLAILVAAFQ